MKDRNRWFYSCLCVLIGFFALVTAGCGTKTVHVASVEMKDMPVHISTDANVVSLHQATIEPTVSGQVATMHIKVGDQVTVGQVIATLDTAPLQAQLASLESQLGAPAVSSGTDISTVDPVISNAQVAQAKQLRESGEITQKEYDIILSRATPTTVARATPSAPNRDTSGITAAIAQIEQQIAQSTIVSPMAGTVSAIYNEDRKIAIAGRPFAMIQQATPVVASVTIPQEFAKKLAMPEGQATTTVYLKVDTDTIPGVITYIDTNAIKTAPSVLVKATFDNALQKIRPGEFYTLVIASNATAPILVVPQEAVHTNNDGTYVYVVTDDNTIDVRAVETGETVDGYTVILSGVKEHEQVVTSKGNYQLGDRVKVS